MSTIQTLTTSQVARPEDEIISVNSEINSKKNNQKSSNFNNEMIIVNASFNKKPNEEKPNINNSNSNNISKIPTPYHEKSSISNLRNSTDRSQNLRFSKEKRGSIDKKYSNDLCSIISNQITNRKEDTKSLYSNPMENLMGLNNMQKMNMMNTSGRNEEGDHIVNYFFIFFYI